jgi:hypothetical protein
MSPRALIAIKSCARDTENGFNDAVRNTWLRDLKGANYVFVLGRGAKHTKPDELILDCPDDYLGLPWKTKALIEWSIQHEFDFTCLVDTDTFVRPGRLLASGFEQYDYVGWFNGTPGQPKEVYRCLWAWASGGSGYWVSRKAAREIVRADMATKSMCPELRIPCEDLGVGQVLGPLIMEGVISAKHDPRYFRGYSPDFKADITAHYCSAGENRPFDPSWMYAHYAANRT